MRRPPARGRSAAFEKKSLRIRAGCPNMMIEKPASHRSGRQVSEARRRRGEDPHARTAPSRDETRRREACAFRHDAARCASRRSRDQRPDRDLEAQCAISSRRISLFLFRLHGCDRGEPLSAGAGLSKGAARQQRLYRLQARKLREAAREVLAAHRRHDDREQRGRNPESRRAHQGARRADRQGRSRGGISAMGKRQGLAGRPRQLRNRRCAFPARTPAGAQDESRAREAAGGLRAGRRLDARRLRKLRAGDDEARSRRPAAPGRSRARPHLRILPDHRRHEPQPGSFGSAPRER